MRLLLIQRGAADFFRHCSLLHDYCSYPLGTSPLSLSLPHSLWFSLSLSPCIHYLDTPSLFHSLHFPSFLFSFFILLWSKFRLRALRPPSLILLPLSLLLAAVPVPRLNCSSLCFRRLITSSQWDSTCCYIKDQSSPPRALGHVPE